VSTAAFNDDRTDGPTADLVADPIACVQCDLLLPMPVVAEGERADCPRCGAPLISVPRDGLKRSFAFALSAVVFMVIAVSYPFMTMKAGGFENEMTLPQAALELYEYGMVALSAVVFAAILVIPAAMLGLILALVAQLRRGVPAPWLVPVGRLIFGLGTWCMVEVFVIGVIVSLVKLASMATVVLGISFWAYAAFSICLTAALTSLDRAYIWDEIERTLET
jgi:paraquat-inducible protein A